MRDIEKIMSDETIDRDGYFKKAFCSKLKELRKEKNFRQCEVAELLVEMRLVTIKDFYGLKVLGDGELTKKLKVYAHKFSRSAVEAIEKAGGQAILLTEAKATEER